MPTLRRPRELASFAFAAASFCPVPRAGIDARTTVKPFRTGQAIGPEAFGFGFGRGPGVGVAGAVVVVGTNGGAGGAMTRGEVATIVPGPTVLLVSRPATIPAVAEPAAISRSSRDVKTQSPG